MDPVTEVNGVKQLAREAIAAGFYNIDVDTSTLVDLSKPALKEQQRMNYEQAVELALTVRQLQPDRSAARSAKSERRTRRSKSSGRTWTASTGLS